MIKRLLASIFILAGLAQPVFSQADHLLDIYDRPIAISASHVFILRHVQDNLADYESQIRDVYLVSKNLDTGFDDQIWPVARVKLDVDDLDNILAVHSRVLENSMNPYAVFADHDAHSSMSEMRNVGDQFAAEITYAWDGISLMNSKISLSDAFGQIEQSIEMTSQAIQPYSEADLTQAANASPQELLAKIALGIDTCEHAAVSTVGRIGQNAHSPLARLFCYDDNFEITAAIIIVLPKVDKSG